MLPLLLSLLLTLPPSPPPVEKHLVVLVAHRNNAPAFTKTVEAIRTQLSDLPVHLKVVWRGSAGVADPPLTKTMRLHLGRRVASRTGAQIVLFCEFEEEDKLSLYVPSWEQGERSRRERFVQRTVQKGETKGRYDALALILRSSLRALMHHLPVPPTGRNVQMKPATPPLQFGRSNSTLRGLSFQVGLLSQSYSADLPLLPGALLEARLKFTSRFTLTGGYIAFLSPTIKGNRGDLTLHRHPIQLGILSSHRVDAHTFGVSLSLGLDIVLVETHVRSLFMVAVPPKGHVSLSSTLQAHYVYRVGSSLSLFAQLGAEIFLRNTYYVLEGYDNMGVYAQERIAVPWTVQPRITLGIELHLF